MRSRKKSGNVAKRHSDGENVCDFIETFCRQTEGENAGQPIRIRDWQRAFITELFTLRADGRRQYRQALIGMARKNGKSSLAASLALYLLLMDGEPGAEVYSVAGDKDQARIVFGTAKRMIEMDEELRGALTLYKDAVEHPASGSVYRVMSADAPTKEGLNPSGVVFDELHVQPSRELWDVMTLGSGTRRQPLVIAITTAGHDVDGTICGELYRYGKRVESGEIDDKTFFFRWWEPSRPDCDWRDPQVWRECNPALGDFLYIEALEEAARTKPENVFRRYHLDQWVAAAEAWLPYGAWDKCENRMLDLDRAYPLHVAVDSSLRGDSTAVSMAQKRDGRTVLRCRIWENPYGPEDSRHGAWKLNRAEVKNFLIDLYHQFPKPAAAVDGEVRPGPAFLYDPAFFEDSAQELEGEGLNLVEYPQTDSRMIPASQTFYTLILEQSVAHDGDPALKRHIGNVVADQKPRGAWRISKPRGSRKKIDAAVSSAIAVWHAQQPEPEEQQSVYESRGVLLL